MRGVKTLIIGLFTISAIVMMMGLLLEPIASLVVGYESVQALGWADDAEQIRDTILRWIPLLFIIYLLVWAGMWAFRRERTTGVRR